MGQDKKARAVNRNWTRPTNNRRGAQPISRRCINKILFSLENIMENEGHVPVEYKGKRDFLPDLIVASRLKIAIRENNGLPWVFCPDCRKKVEVATTAQCPVCAAQNPAAPQLPVETEDLVAEANSIKAGNVFFDKLFPNLASLDAKINIEGQMTVVSQQISKIIIQYVPAAQRMQCLDDIDKLLENVEAQFADS